MPARSPSRPADPGAPRLHWWKEVLIIGIFYSVYSLVRNQFGSARIDSSGVARESFNHALEVIRAERFFGLYREREIQNAFVNHGTFLQFWNVFYGTAHFIVTVFTFLSIYRYSRHRFVRWRNTLASTTALALVGFSLYPLMPPRLLTEGGPYGGAGFANGVRLAFPIDFIDTLKVYGGPWSFDSGAMTKVSNQFAAMPSLHCAWSVWCCLALWPLFRRGWQRAALAAYPIATMFCIVVTGNHYGLDAIGGLITLAAGFALGDGLHRANQRRLARAAEMGARSAPDDKLADSASLVDQSAE